MNRIASMPVTERRVVFAEAAERLQIQTVIVEKDFWLCWTPGYAQCPAWHDALRLVQGRQWALSKVSRDYPPLFPILLICQCRPRDVGNF